MGVANNQIDNNKKYMSNAGNFHRHADTAVWWVAHHSMEHIRGFMGSH